MLPHESSPFEWTIEGQSVSVFGGRDGEVQYLCIPDSDVETESSSGAFLTKIVCCLQNMHEHTLIIFIFRMIKPLTFKLGTKHF